MSTRAGSSFIASHLVDITALLSVKSKGWPHNGTLCQCKYSTKTGTTFCNTYARTHTHTEGMCHTQISFSELMGLVPTTLVNIQLQPTSLVPVSDLLFILYFHYSSPVLALLSPSPTSLTLVRPLPVHVSLARHLLGHSSGGSAK